MRGAVTFFLYKQMFQGMFLVPKLTCQAELRTGARWETADLGLAIIIWALTCLVGPTGEPEMCSPQGDLGDREVTTVSTICLLFSKKLSGFLLPSEFP